MMIEKKIILLGAASGIAGANIGVAEGPKVIQKSALFQQLQTKFAAFVWQAMLETTKQPADIYKELTQFTTELALQTAAFTKEKEFFMVLGGDHACAIGTWSGVAEALHAKGNLGLIWIDAHMDSHTQKLHQANAFTACRLLVCWALGSHHSHRSWHHARNYYQKIFV